MTEVYPVISNSALIVVDMQNDFVHPKGVFGLRSKEKPELKIDMEFLSSTIVTVKKLTSAFRKAGRPVIYIAHVVKADKSDAAFPSRLNPQPEERPFITEGTWGAQIMDELAPEKGEHLVIKKGFSGFANTPLNTILGNLGVNTCFVCGVTTSVCVSSTTRLGVEYNYRMIVISDATAEVQRELHDAELKILKRVFADIKTTDEVINMLKSIK